MSKLLAIVLCSIVASTAIAGDRCADSGNTLPGCRCNPALKTSPIPTPKGFTLCAAYDVADEHFKPIDMKNARGIPPDRFDFGSYWYQGEAILSGVVEKVYDEEMGDQVTFYPDQRRQAKNERRNLSRLQEYVLLKSMFIGDEKKIGAANLPMSSLNNRWCANVTLRVTKLQVYVADTCSAGVGAMDFQVVRSGQFKKCTGESPSH